jgi:hypothetical protein
MSSNTLYLTARKMVHLRRKCYKSIDFLNTEIYKPGKQHPLIYIKTVSTRDANRIPIKLKVVSGQYIFTHRIVIIQ